MKSQLKELLDGMHDCASVIRGDNCTISVSKSFLKAARLEYYALLNRRDEMNKIISALRKSGDNNV